MEARLVFKVEVWGKRRPDSSLSVPITFLPLSSNSPPSLPQHSSLVAYSCGSDCVNMGAGAAIAGPSPSGGYQHLLDPNRTWLSNWRYVSTTPFSFHSHLHLHPHTLPHTFIVAYFPTSIMLCPNVLVSFTDFGVSFPFFSLTIIGLSPSMHGSYSSKNPDNNACRAFWCDEVI
jgi:hypothetical protein